MASRSASPNKSVGIVPRALYLSHGAGPRQLPARPLPVTLRRRVGINRPACRAAIAEDRSCCRLRRKQSPIRAAYHCAIDPRITCGHPGSAAAPLIHPARRHAISLTLDGVVGAVHRPQSVRIAVDDVFLATAPVFVFDYGLADDVRARRSAAPTARRWGSTVQPSLPAHFRIRARVRRVLRPMETIRHAPQALERGSPAQPKPCRGLAGNCGRGNGPDGNVRRRLRAEGPWPNGTPAG